MLADKVSPKLGEYQNQLNEKLGGEISKVQNRLQSKLQENLGNKLQENLGGALQQQIQGRLGGFLGGGSQTPAGQGVPATPAASGSAAQPSLENELIKGIGNLLGR